MGLEIVQGPLNNATHEDLVKLEDEIENHKPENPEVDNNDKNDDKLRNDEQDITGVDEEADDNDGSTLRRGKGRESKILVTLMKNLST